MSINSRNTRRVRGLDAEVRGLLTENGLQPLSARSLLLSYLLGLHPPELDVAQLIRFGEVVGLRPGTVRTALSRLAANGDATVSDGRYRLGDRLVERQAQQDAGLTVTPRATGWDGAWWTVVVTPGERPVAERRRFRAALTGHRFGELRPEVWMRPADDAAPELDGVAIVRGPLTSGDPVQLAHLLWDLDDLERLAVRLIAALERTSDSLADDPAQALRPAFEVSAACVRFLRIEPRLPPSLVALDACRELRHRYHAFAPTFADTLSAATRAA